MYLLKTSGIVIDTVLCHQKHAFPSQPTDWESGELLLISLNKADCKKGDKQIYYTMRLADIRPLKEGEAERYWPANNGRLKYLFICEDVNLVRNPFDLRDVLGEEYKVYAPVAGFKL